MKKPVVLRIYKGEQLLGVKQFLDEQIVFGRPGEVQVWLDSEKVSLLHASIEERAPGQFFVADLGSEAGTMKNGELILEAPIESGDVLTIADFRIEFYVGVPKPRVSGDTTITTITPPAATTAASESGEKSAAPKEQRTEPPVEAKPEPKVEPKAELKLEEKSAIPVQGKPDATQPPSSGESPGAVEKPPAAKPPLFQVTKKPDDVDLESSAIVTMTSTESKPEPKVEAKPEPKVEAKPEPKVEAKPEPKVEAKPEPKVEAPKVPDAPPTSATQPPKMVSTPPIAVSSASSASKASTPPVARVDQAPVTMATAAMGGAGVGAAPTLPVQPRMQGGVVKKSSHKSKARKKTFAPPSRYSNVKEFVKPSKGTVVEVLVAWKERVIATYHFSKQGVMTIGSHPQNDIVVPIFNSNVRKFPILKIDRQATILLSPEMGGELSSGQLSSGLQDLIRQNRVSQQPSGYLLHLEQGEMMRVDLSEQVSVIFRYVSDSPKPLVAPFFDLSTSEFAGVVLSFVLVATLWLYVALYTPPKGLPSANVEEPERTAIIVLTPPTPPPLPPPEPVAQVATPTPLPAPTPPPQIVKATPQPKPTEQKVVQAKPKEVTNLTRKNDNGMSAAAAPNKNKTGPRQLTSPKQGGAIKVANKEGAQMQSKSRDISKMGMFSTLGVGGAQDKIAGATTGSGELTGMANAASGTAGSAVNRAGNGLGSQLKDTGQGGNGKSLDGIAGGISTSGRGSGNSGYGVGGLGDKAGMKIVTGGAGEAFSGTIDREAIRRVIQANLRVIRQCYQNALNRKTDLFGKVVIEWEIGEQGRVLSAKVKNDEIGEKSIGDCVVRNLKTWRFPEPPSSQVVEVAYPFFFSN